MTEYPINKGIGRSVEFKGLKSQYLFIFVGGLLAVFIVFVILYLLDLPDWLCIGVGVIAATLLVWQTFTLNAKYGEYGMMKLQARGYRPQHIINRKRFNRLIIKR